MGEEEADKMGVRKNIVSPLVHSADVHNSWGRARSKPRARNRTGSPTWVAGAQVFGLSPAAFQGVLSRAASEMHEQWLSYGIPASQITAWYAVHSASTKRPLNINRMSSCNNYWVLSDKCCHFQSTKMCYYLNFLCATTCFPKVLFCCCHSKPLPFRFLWD